MRRETILEHVREVRAVVDAANGAAPGGAPPGPSGGGGGGAGRRSGFLLGAYLFPPSLAPLVGQDYAALAPHLDLVSPMLYRTIEGDACLASEVGALSALGLLAPRGPFTAQDVGAEVALARAALGMSPAEGGAGPRPLLRPRLVPILQLADEAVAETTAAALGAGADGVDYFAYRAGTERYVAQVAEVAATVRGAPWGAPGPDATLRVGVSARTAARSATTPGPPWRAPGSVPRLPASPYPGGMTKTARPWCPGRWRCSC